MKGLTWQEKREREELRGDQVKRVGKKARRRDLAINLFNFLKI